MQKLTAYEPELQCELTMAIADTDGIVRLYFPEGDCCDMRGAIRFCRKMAPNVWYIQTYSGKKRDTTYEKIGTDEWVALSGWS